MFKIAVFVSGRGSNLRAILDYDFEGLVAVAGVFSNKPDCPALELAKKLDIPFFVVGNKEEEGRISYKKLAEHLKSLKIDLIVLAGFLKKIPDEVVDSFPAKIINIHPALLPSFGGHGMYGINVHNAVFNSSAKISGATVHFVDKIYDNGFIIDQQCVDISDVASPEEIASRVLKAEHQLLPSVIKMIAEGRVTIQNNRVFLTR